MNTKRWFGRKTWAAIAAIATSIGSAVSGEITWAVAIPLIVGTLATFIMGTGIESAGESKAAAIKDAAKTAALAVVKPSSIVPILLACCLALTFLSAPAQAQVTTTQTLTLPATRSMSSTPLSLTSTEFAITYLNDGHHYGLAPYGAELWRSGKLFSSQLAIVKPENQAQIATATVIGYNIDLSNALSPITKNKAKIVLTPLYGLNIDLTNGYEGRVNKATWGGSLNVSWFVSL